jgi:hypothetical protein
MNGRETEDPEPAIGAHSACGAEENKVHNAEFFSITCRDNSKSRIFIANLLEEFGE